MALSWGLVGASNVAETRMVRALQAIGDRVVAVQSADAQRGSDFALRNRIARSTTSVDELLDSGIDAVYVSSKNEFHHDHALRSLRAGKHVLCEKPLALNVADAEDLIDVAAAGSLVLATNHHLPGSPLHVAARRLVSEGRIGRVLSARVHHAVSLPEHLRGWRLAGSTPGSGVVMDITCHDASVLNPLLGTPLTVVALGVSQLGANQLGHNQHQQAAVDAAMTVIEYRSPTGDRILAQTHDAFTVAFDRTSLEIQGESGSILVLDAMTQDARGSLLLSTVAGQVEIEVDTSADLYQIILEAFGAAVDGRGAPTATGADGLLALKVAMAAEASIQTGAACRVD